MPFTKDEYDKAIEQRERDRGWMREEWNSDPLLNAANALRIQLEKIREEIATFEKTTQSGSSVFKRSQKETSLKNAKDMQGALRKMEDDLTNLLTVAIPTGGMSGMRRISDSDYHAQLNKILNQKLEVQLPQNLNPILGKAWEKAQTGIEKLKSQQPEDSKKNSPRRK